MEFVDILSDYWYTILTAGIGLLLIIIDIAFVSKPAGYIATILLIVAFVAVLPINYSNVNDFSYCISKADNAIDERNYAKAHRYLRKANPNAAVFWVVPENRRRYEATEARLFHVEANYLLSEAILGSTERLIGLISEIQIFGSPVLGITGDLDVQNRNDIYIHSVDRYNSMLDGVIRRALSTENIDAVSQIIPLYKPNLVKTLVCRHIFAADEYDYEYTYEAQEKAQTEYEKHKNTLEKQR